MLQTGFTGKLRSSDNINPSKVQNPNPSAFEADLQRELYERLLESRVGESQKGRTLIEAASPSQTQTYKALDGTVKPVITGESEPASR